MRPASAIRASVKRSGLVGAQHVHGAKIVDRGKPFDHHALFGHAQRAARQRHRHDHRQQLRRQTDGKRDRKQEGFEHRAAEREMRQQHEQHEEDGQPQDQQAKRWIPRSKRSAAAAGKRGRDAAEAVALPVATTSIVASPLTTEVPANNALNASGGVVASQGPGYLSTGKGSPVISASLTCAFRLLQHDPIGRDQVTGPQLDHVARHEPARPEWR